MKMFVPQNQRSQYKNNCHDIYIGTIIIPKFRRNLIIVEMIKHKPNKPRRGFIIKRSRNID
jgi:hypothetical protein